MITATTARDLIAEIRRRGGRVYRYLEVKVIVITDDLELAKDLVALGASYGFMLPEGYNRAFFTKDSVQEWDLEIGQLDRPERIIYDDDGDVVEVVPARFPGLWEAAALPAAA